MAAKNNEYRGQLALPSNTYISAAASAFEGLAALAYNEFLTGDYVSAERHCMQLIKQDPTNYGLLHLLSTVHLRSNKLDECAHYSSLALKYNPDLADAHANLGDVCKERGQLQEAMRSYEQAIKLKPNLITRYINFAGDMVASGDKEQAVATYKAALQHYPDLKNVQDKLYDLLLSLGKLDEAKAVRGRSNTEKC